LHYIEEKKENSLEINIIELDSVIPTESRQTFICAANKVICLLRTVSGGF